MKLTHASWGFFIFIIFATLAPSTAGAAGLSGTDIVAAINQERSSRGMSSLRIDPALTRAAQSRSAVLAQAGQIFHVSAPAGTPWPEISKVGYRYTLAGENLALGIETPGELASRWMASPAHRKNILEGSFEDVGVGITSGYYEGQLVSYVVSYYAKKAGAAPTSISQAAPVISPVPVAAPIPRTAVAAQVSVPKSSPSDFQVRPRLTRTPRVSVPKAAKKASAVASSPSLTSAKAPVRKVEANSPVLSSKYTLETLPPAIPDITVSRDEGGTRVRIIDQIVAFFDSYLRAIFLGRM